VASLDSFSGHADRSELRRYVECMTGDIRRIAVIHGEESQCLAFSEILRKMKPQADVRVPELGEVIDF
jgi:predicted metal-dependent RNase